MPGLDPGIDQTKNHIQDGWPGTGYAKASPGISLVGLA
jgi:hypothetical protein